jgi:hypothetical protein
LSPRPTNTITVPSCTVHNNDRAADDEYFRTRISMACADDPRAQQLFDGPVTRQLQRNAAEVREILLGSNPRTPITAPDGSIVGHSPTFQIDANRFQNVVESIVRGIYFHELGTALPADVPIAGFRTYFPDTPGNRELMGMLNRRYVADNGEDFQYFFGVAEDDATASILVLHFYRVFAILTGTGANNPFVTEHGAHAPGS